MLSVSPSMMVRSSLEEMLDSLRRRDEDEKPKDLPPALPSRPTSKARRPSAKRSLPNKFEDSSATFSCVKKEETEGGTYCGKKLKEGEPDELACVDSVALEHMEYNQRPEENGSANLSSESPSSSLPKLPKSDLNDNFGYFIKMKHRIWCQLENGQWESGQIQSISSETADVLLVNGSMVTVSTNYLLPANPDVIEGVDDLIQLTYLNEPSVLHNLQYRYSRDMIYCMSGPVLIAINPFKKVELCGNDYAAAYRQKLLDSPHVYAVADTCYSEMMKDGVNQSIVISGESGSGKTETAKFAMQYLGALGGGGNGGVELELIQTSNILEAFGNAKTSLNDNSSRFGKLVEIHFSVTGNLCGATIETFLLEKSRVVNPARGERSYHIFYQLCAGAPSALREKLNLKAASEYKYLNQSSCLTVDNIDDAQKFIILMEALDTISMSREDLDHLFEGVAAVLWLGNISFQAIDSEDHVEAVADEASATAASLIGCSWEDLKFALSTDRIQLEKDYFAKKLTLQQAIIKRDATAELLYASLFDWLVGKINSSLEKDKQQSGRSIIILDIFGFESFQKNSLEQLYINYANERLQQHYIRHLLKLQQEEYESDGIDWTKVEFRDNKECLDMFEKDHTGLLSLLDKELQLNNTSNLTFVDKLDHHCKTNPCFKGKHSGAFTIRHYAGEVLYDTSGFLEKYRDSLHSDTIQLLSSCRGQLLQLFASSRLNHRRQPECPLSQFCASELHKLTIVTKLRGQLFKLIQRLENSTPQFIRCIKPNSKQIPGMYERDLILKQLQCCEIFQVVRISRFGYPTRMTHQDFAERYAVLSKFGVCGDPLSASISVLQQFGVRPEMYQFGYTKLFLKAGQIDALEEARKQLLLGTLEVKKCFCSHPAHRYFDELKGGVVSLQSFVRAANARRKYDDLINQREQVLQKTPDEQQRAVLQLQSVIRGWLARKQVTILYKLKKLNQESLGSSHSMSRRLSEVKEITQVSKQVMPLVVEELQNRVLMVETTLEKKEQENAALRDQVQQYEARRLEYEGKMKSVKDMWQKQTTSLRMSLAAVKRSLAENTAVQPGRQEGSPSPHSYDSDDRDFTETQTPGGTPIKLTNSVTEFGSGRQSNGNGNTLCDLMKEFEQRTQTFDDGAKAIIEVKSGHLASANPDKELRNLKNKFETWIKDYKSRLREAKATLRKLGFSDTEKHHRKWWAGLSKR